MSNLFESSIGDIIDVIFAVSDVVTDDENNGLFGVVSKKLGKGNQFKGSITRQANNLIMTFPILMSNTISSSTAFMISKAIERKMVVLLQMLFASSALVSDGEAANVQDVIKRYYTGIDFKTMTIDDVIKVMERLDLSEAHKIELNRAIKNGEYYLNEMNKVALNMPVAELNNFNEENISSMSVSSGIIRNINEANGKKPTIQERNAKRLMDDYDEISRWMYGMGYDEIEHRVKDHEKQQQRREEVRKTYDIYRDMLKQGVQARFDNKNFEKMVQDMDLAKARDEREEAMQTATLAYHKAQLDRIVNQEERDEYIHRIQKYYILPNQMAQQRLDFMKKQLLDSDVKKANEMVPSMLVVDFYLAGSGDTIKGTGIVGVKSRIVPVESAEIVDRIASKSKAKAGLVNLIRATTGETKFFKDFILNIDRAKVDAVARSKRGSVNPMWRVLERRANKQALRKALAQKNDASPITTLVMTSEEVDYLKKVHAIDLDNVRIANELLDAYNLMGLAIVDESAEVVKFLWDGEMNTFEPVSFLAMDREDREGGSTYKKVINLMAKSQY